MMKLLLSMICGVICSLQAAAMDIGDGIRTGERVLLGKAVPSDNEAAVRIATVSFERVLAARGAGKPVTLRVTSKGVTGEALMDSIVLVNETIAELPEDERLFEIAHEIGHIDLDHLEQQIAIYRQFVGTSTDDAFIARTLNAHMFEFSPALQALELEADAYAQQLLARIPGAEQGGIHTLERNVFRRADYSHPSPRERMQRLQAMQTVLPHIAALSR